jgi:hypothetical protein
MILALLGCFSNRLALPEMRRFSPSGQLVDVGGHRLHVAAQARARQRGRNAPMKAAVYTRYGPPDVVRIEDAETPMPKENEVLIKVRAASVNPLDAGLMKGKPHSFRILFGLRKP